ncbi:hypothetical protein [Luteimonas deserti]|uniref:DUF2007 domain-containing protein n=1 Tax=Luteimonas deserti TaxID=2752306 RepID=A0A7Z0QSB0_9GAMM|nr:hypothetical protein [Luteimonas deserti]NYZ63957.1 hypothetical protein [Luteimonas deserti]
MRQVFTSPRLENVERVAELLRAESIEVRITNGRSYKGQRRANFSYREDSGAPRPAVWVIRAEDQTRARELLRGAGLLQNQPSTRRYLGQDDLVFASERAETPRRGMSRASKVRYTLLGGAALVIALSWMSRPDTAARVAATSSGPTPAPAPRVEAAPPTVEASVNRIPVPRALAEAVLLAELADLDGPACIRIDGAAPDAALLGRLQADAPGVVASPACGGESDPGTASIEVANYRTDGSGVGTVDVTTGAPATVDRTTRTLDVARTGRDWRIGPAG